MRVRATPLIAVVFGAAAAVSAFVVSQMPREGQTSPPARVATAPAPDETSPVLKPPAGPGDGAVEVHVTAGGEPQAGADVRLYLAPAAGTPWRRAGNAPTDRYGVARLPARRGAYLVAVRAPGLAPGRSEVVRTADEELSHTEVALEPVAALHGRAAVREGGPAAGARIRAIPLVSRWPGLEAPSAPPEETAVTIADAAGTFRIDGLSPGSWAVTVEATGHHPVLLPRVTVPGDALAVAVERLGEVAGTVLHAEGRPAAGAVVRAFSGDHGASARTGPDGRFTLAAPAGRYVLAAVLGERAGTAAAPVAIAAGAVVRGVEVHLGPAASVEGAVSRAGAPAAGAEVVLFAHGTRERVAHAVASVEGRFVMGPLAPGAYDLRAVAPGASPAQMEGLTLAPGARFPAHIALRGTGSVVGTVRDPAGRALAGVRVRAAQHAESDGAAPAEARTDFEGRFRLDGLAVGRVEIAARLEGVLLGAVGAVEIREGGASRLDLLLPEAGTVVGRVSQHGRPPPAGTTVVAVAMNAGPRTLQVARAAADGRGNYRLALPAGDYRVHAAPGHEASTELRVAPSFARVEPRQTARLDLALAPPAHDPAVEILVLEPGGAPSPGAVVTLARPDDGRVALAMSAGEDGRVAIDRHMGLAGQRVTIRARNGGRTGAVTVALPAAGAVPIRLSPGGSLAGVVRGAHAGGFTLEIASQPAAGGWRTLAVHRYAGDRFDLGDLPPEPLRLAIRADDGRRGTAEVRVPPGETRTVDIAVR